MHFLISFVIVTFVRQVLTDSLIDIDHELLYNVDLPKEHLSAYFNNLPDLVKRCLNNETCTYNEFLNSSDYNKKLCRGYEQNCRSPENIHKCPGNHSGYVKSKEAQLEVFFDQGDFGYIKQQVSEMAVMCEATFITDSSLECSKYLRFCRGRNLMVNFTDLVHRKEPIRYAMDVLKQGQIGGYCKLHNERLKTELQHISALQSWGPELRFFEAMTKRPIDSDLCDVVIDTPTYIMKIDATVNMYHHFCDFFNLYASQHVNFSHNRAFETDINILLWESYSYASPFGETFKAFTENPLMDLNTFKGKVVCFKNLVLPLLPRMIFGLFYNTPIINGCENSALFHSFSEHILHRLQIVKEPVKTNTKLRITFLSRDTKHRQVMNEDELIKKISLNKDYDVQRVSYGRNISFRDQLAITSNTDIFIGMHGAGLTHLLFLPKWATLFELHNCEDPNCYKDLARLRGVNYITWEDDELMNEEGEGSHPESGAKHAKFINYSFNSNEFVRLVTKAAKYVKSHPSYNEFIEESQVNRDEL
ncbi:unnamed protein product [Diamesa serratosioi]